MRRLLSALPVAVCSLVLAGPAAAQSPPAGEPRIAEGISAKGVDIGGLTVPEAAAKLESVLTPTLSRDVILGVAGRPWRLEVADVDFKLDAERTAKRGLYAPRGTTEVPVATTHSLGKVRAWVESVGKRIARKPRNARGRITLRRVTIRRARHGHRLDTNAARKLVSAALDDATASRVLHMRVTKIRPKLTTTQLRRRWRTVITVDKRTFKLRLFKNQRVRRTYRVATGLPAYPTPSGLFSIVNKQVNPTWSVPNSPWAGELAGTTVRGGTAANPLKARWMGIVNGVGIHGTGQEWSIGSRASHGCLRMRVRDVIDLYRRVPVGTPVLIR